MTPTTPKNRAELKAERDAEDKIAKDAILSLEAYAAAQGISFVELMSEFFAEDTSTSTAPSTVV